MPLEDGGQLRPVNAGSRRGSEFLVEAVAAARKVDDQYFRRFRGEVQECVREPRRHERKPAFVTAEDLVAHGDLESTFQDVDCLVLFVMDVERRASVRRHFDDEVVEGAGRVIAGGLEDEVSPGSRLEPPSLMH